MTGVAPDGRVVGRDGELAEIEAAGHQVLVLEGEPGIGKTTLWREVVRRAEEAGRLVLSARPTQTETKLSYASLADLLRPLPASAFASLPDLQRDALDVALLRSTAGAAEPLAIAAGTLAALTQAARDQPVLVAIDDAQWLDAASAAAISYALRRIAGEQIAVLACTRPLLAQRRRRFDVPDAHVVRLTPLSVAAVHDVLKLRLQLALPRPLLVRVHEACRGNPFYALELGRELADSTVEAGQPVPVPSDLSAVVRRRLRRLSAETRETLLVSAASGAPSRPHLARVLGGDPTVALEEAEEADVIVLDGEVVRFSHPLYAAAIYAAAPRAARVRAHSALAAAASDNEERVRHLALAADAPSAAVADELERTAETVRRRGAAVAAAALHVEAARLTPPELGALRHLRELRAAQAFFDGADSEAAKEILAALVESMQAGPDRARALLLQGLIHSYDGEQRAATRSVERAIEDAQGQPRLLAETYLHLALFNYEDSHGARQSAAEARALVENDPDAPDDLVAAVLLDDAYMGLYLGDGLPHEQVGRAIGLVPRDGRTWLAQRAQVVVYLWAKYTDDLVRARELLDDLVALRRAEGNDYEARGTMRHLAEVECWLGNWARAGALAAEVHEVATDRAMSLYVIALVAACRGDVDEGLAAAESGLELSGDNPWYRALNLSVLGFIGLSRGDFAGAVVHLDSAAACVAHLGMQEPARFRFDGDRLEALLAVGRLSDAEALVEQLGRRAAITPRPWNCVMRDRGRALLSAAAGDVEGALAAVDSALREHERLPIPLELGRTWLVKGEIERRAKRRGAANDSLTRALAEFERLGAARWAQRARDGLARLGLRRALDELTESERRVAELAAAGLTNREVAARLFISPKTVESNLARAYRKLGIRTRAQLGAQFADRGPAAGQT